MYTEKDHVQGLIWKSFSDEILKQRKELFLSGSQCVYKKRWIFFAQSYLSRSLWSERKLSFILCLFRILDENFYLWLWTTKCRL